MIDITLEPWGPLLASPVIVIGPVGAGVGAGVIAGVAAGVIAGVAAGVPAGVGVGVPAGVGLGACVGTGADITFTVIVTFAHPSAL